MAPLAGGQAVLEGNNSTVYKRAPPCGPCFQYIIVLLSEYQFRNYHNRLWREDDLSRRMTFTIKIPKNVADKIRTLPNLNEGSFYYFIGIDGPNELILLTLAPSSLMEEYGERSDL